MDARHSYREGAGRGASGVRLVMLLYEQVIQDLGRALKAMEEKNIERRTREINHALTVIGHLQGTLNPEVKGKVVGNLARFYASLRAGLVQAQVQSSSQILRQQITHLLEVREAWMEVERASSVPASHKSQAQTGIAGADWRG